MDDNIELIVERYALQSTNVRVADVAMALGTIMMSIDGYVDEEEIGQAKKFGELLFGYMDESKLKNYQKTANLKTHRLEINLQVAKRLIENINFELTNKDRLAIFAYLSAIAVADKKVTPEETDLLNLVLSELELKDLLPLLEIDEEIKYYGDSSDQYKSTKENLAKKEGKETGVLVGLISNITDHYSNLSKDFTSSLLRLSALGKIDARQHDILLNTWLTSSLETKVGLGTAARSDPEFLLNWLDSSDLLRNE